MFYVIIPYVGYPVKHRQEEAHYYPARPDRFSKKPLRVKRLAVSKNTWAKDRYLKPARS